MDSLGWMGTFVYLANHVLFSWRLSYPRRAYYAFNLIAAVLLVFSSTALRSWHPVLNNSFWALVSLLALTGHPLIGLRFTPPAKAGLALLVVLAAGVASLMSVAPLAALEVMGWTSVLTYALAYLSFTARSISRAVYLAANLCAALLQIPVLIHAQNWQVFALQVAWAFISALALMLNRSPLADPPHPQASRNESDKP